ncbi:hypothetical protein BPAE_0012g00260 [Botrytis paeoniae]|uniref:Uncharacterized protein n=1 Tax=Botrytis paeoniae TaxID=278948 RepID=A0A4Z1G2S5_9HELO|nr:hypothetical protein BPAE_0012g00260 [Botrytis paeoniae]
MSLSPSLLTAQHGDVLFISYHTAALLAPKIHRTPMTSSFALITENRTDVSGNTTLITDDEFKKFCNGEEALALCCKVGAVPNYLMWLYDDI